MHPLFDHTDERQEERAIETILVEEVWPHIGCRDDHHAAREQSLEKPAKDHRIRDVGDAELVETQKPGFLGDGIRHRRDLVAAFGRSRCAALGATHGGRRGHVAMKA